MGGIIPVYKPIGFSFYDSIRIYKKKTGFKGKIGDSETLDVSADRIENSITIDDF